MKFLRFGSTVVNMERVNSIELSTFTTGPTAYLYFSAPAAPHGIDSLQADFVKLEGGDCIALEQWLEENCEDARESMSVEE